MTSIQILPCGRPYVVCWVSSVHCSDENASFVIKYIPNYIAVPEIVPPRNPILSSDCHRQKANPY